MCKYKIGVLISFSIFNFSLSLTNLQAVNVGITLHIVLSKVLPGNSGTRAVRAVLILQQVQERHKLHTNICAFLWVIVLSNGLTASSMYRGSGSDPDAVPVEVGEIQLSAPTDAI